MGDVFEPVRTDTSLSLGSEVGGLDTVGSDEAAVILFVVGGFGDNSESGDGKGSELHFVFLFLFYIWSRIHFDLY